MDRIDSFCCESFMADRTGLDSTTLHYLAVRQALISIHVPVHSKSHYLNCSLTRQTDHCTPQRMAHHRNSASCYQLAQSILKIDSALTEMVGRREVGGCHPDGDSDGG